MFQGVIQDLLNTCRPRQNGRYFPDNILKYIFLNGNIWISIKISIKCVPRGPINNNPDLVQILTWRPPGDKTWHEPMTVSLLTHMGVTRHHWVSTLMPRENVRHFSDDIFNYVFLNENVWIPIKISLKFVPKGQINHIPALVQIMVWRLPGDKPLSEPMLVSLPTHICVFRPQWVNISCDK